MPWKQWAYMERVPSDQFQSYLQNQVIPQFTSTSQRDTMWTAPPRGALCVTIDTDTLWYWNGAAWISREPERVIYESKTTAQVGANFTAETTLFVTSALQFITGRNYYWRLSARFQITAAGTLTLRVRQTNLGGPIFGTGELYLPGALAASGNFYGPIIALPPGSQVIAVTGQASAGTGSLQGFTNAPNIFQILERT